MKLKYVDALRGIAIIGVVLTHCSQYGNNENLPNILSYIFANGRFGVQLFFMVSAYTLFLSMENKKESEGNDIIPFFIRRFFRIAPMYYMGIIYYLWQDGFGPRYWLGNQEGISIFNILSNFLFIHGMNPYWINSLVPGGWSIAVEMLFYVIVPFLFLWVKNSNSAARLFIVSLAIMLIARFILNSYSIIEEKGLWMDYLYFYLPNQLPIFSLGILFFFLVKENYKPPISGNIFLLGVFIAMLHLNGIIVLPQHILFGLAFFALGLILSKWNFVLINNPVLLFIGKISYSLYLVHFAVLHWMEKYQLVDFISENMLWSSTLNFGIRFLLCLSLSALIAYAFFKNIEMPFQLLGKKLIEKYFSGKRTG